MKRSSSRRKRRLAFTLVELLVVMGIIAILAGVIMSAVSSALRYARRTKANSMATMIQTAVQGYYTEYSVYPVVAGTTTDDYYDGTSGGAKWQNLTIALCGNIDPYLGTAATSTIPNTRAIPYMNITRSDLNSTYHAPQNPFGAGQAAPYFFMAVDTDYSGLVGDTGTKPEDFSGTNAVPGTKPVATGVAVWCSCDQAPTSSTSLSAAWAHTY